MSLYLKDDVSDHVETQDNRQGRFCKEIGDLSRILAYYVQCAASTVYGPVYHIPCQNPGGDGPGRYLLVLVPRWQPYAVAGMEGI